MLRFIAMIDCLLVSPTDPLKPKKEHLKFLVGGENTYTQTLLKNPPEGVRYTYYLDAIKKGYVVFGRYGKLFQILTKFRILPLSSGTLDIKLLYKFDLIHCHSYSLRISGAYAPIVMSDSSSNILTLKEYFRWPRWYISSTYFLRKVLHKMLRVNDVDLDIGDYKYLIVFSKFAKHLHRKNDQITKKIKVIYPGLPIPPRGPSQKKGKINILFVGTWFKRKGGDLLIRSYRRLSEKYKNLALTVVGQIPNGENLARLKSFKNFKWVSHERLLNEFYPKADILVLVPPTAEGYGFVAEEAASFGIPAVVTKVGALPEIVEDNVTGFVIKPNSLTDLTKALEILIKDSKKRRLMGRSAKSRFLNKFTIEKSNKKLRMAYDKALSTS